jgi:hypothetical protein
MPVREKKVVASKFPLRLMPSVRRVAENLSRQEGVSLNQFINLAVAEKVAFLQHEEWLAKRSRIREDSVAKALEILDRSSKRKPEPGDELPEGYVQLPRKQPRKSRNTHSKL